MQVSIECLPSKILYFIYLKLQVFLKSCAKASIYSKVKLHLLDWEEDILELCHGCSKITTIAIPPFILLE